jgi:hypothetical protein
MSLIAKIQNFFVKLTSCYRELVPDAYEGVDFHTVDKYATGEKAPAGYIVGGGYGG